MPVLCGAAFKNKGVQPLLDAVVDYLPSPLDVPPVQGTHPKTGEVLQRKADDNEPFTALVFKLMTDKHVGHLTYMRVYSGHVDARASRSSTPAAAARSASAACSRCTPTSARRSTRRAPATSSPWSA